MSDKPDMYSDMHKKMRGRNYTLLAVLLGMAVMFAVVTYVKMKGAA